MWFSGKDFTPLCFLFLHFYNHHLKHNNVLFVSESRIDNMFLIVVVFFLASFFLRLIDWCNSTQLIPLSQQTTMLQSVVEKNMSI